MREAIDRRAVLASLAAALAAAAPGASAAAIMGAAPARGPDLLIALVDAAALAPGAAASAGIAAAVARGLRFTRCYAATASPAATATALYGYHAHQLGAAGVIHDVQSPAPGPVRPIAAELAGVGYTVVDEPGCATPPGGSVARVIDARSGAADAVDAAIDALARRRPGRDPAVVLIGLPSAPDPDDESGLRTPVPLVIRADGLGGTVDRVASVVDIAPTILDLAGAAGVADRPGRSLLLPDRSADRAVFAARGFCARGIYAPLRAVRAGGLIYLRRPAVPLSAGGEALIDARDGRALHDPVALARLRGALTHWRRKTGDHWRPEPAEAGFVAGA